MPRTYWTHAFSTACYLINWMPTTTLNLQSPYFVLHNNHPNYVKLRSFGCLCYPWLRPYTSHKLDHLSSPCVFIGYFATQSAYYCLDPLTHKIYTSRHVKFIETQFLFASSNPTTTTTTTSTAEEWCSSSLTLIISHPPPTQHTPVPNPVYLTAPPSSPGRSPSNNLTAPALSPGRTTSSSPTAPFSTPKHTSVHPPAPPSLPARTSPNQT